MRPTRQGTDRRDRRSRLRAASFLLLCLETAISLSSCGRGERPPEPLEKRAGEAVALEIFERGFPRAFVFRQAEALSQRLPYEAWEARMLSLNGIIGKLVEEERGDVVSPRNLEYFRRYKAGHPEKLALLHIDGVGWLPRFDPELDDEHWLYAAGAHVTEKLGSERSERVLHVSSLRPFRVGVTSAEDGGVDAVIVAIGPDGRPNWAHAEQVRALAAGPAENVVTIERGAFGSEPLAFDEGAYVAPHVALGPFCPGCDLLWLINFSSEAPRDTRGRSGGDMFVERLASFLEPGGTMDFLDGVQIDAFFYEPLRGPFVDVDVDGVADGGVVAGVQTYGRGGLRALEALRERLGDSKIIAMDGGAPYQRTPYGVVNGIEIEGLGSSLSDLSQSSWTSRVNLLRFAGERSRAPRLNYVNHKYLPHLAYPMAYDNFRMALAACQFTDALFTFFIEPQEGSLRFYPNRGAEKVGIFTDELHLFDELVGGQEQQANWLGDPIGPTLQTALARPNLLGSDARAGGEELVFQTVEAEKGKEIRATLPLVDVPTADVLVAMTLRSEAAGSLPPGAGVREVRVRRSGDEEASTGVFDEETSTSYFYLRDIGPGPIRLEIEADFGGPVTIDHLSLHAGPNLVYREFEHGLVLANPSNAAVPVDMEALFPGASAGAGAGWSRLRGSKDQDPITNDGRAVGARLELPAEDALFLRRRETREE